MPKYINDYNGGFAWYRPKQRMQFWKAILSYDGTLFSGWQIQPGLPTVQGSLSDALYRLAGERVLPQGSGRTDAGVHALGQVASFALRAPIPAANLQHALNRLLPPSVRVLSVEPVPSTFHARHSAVRKTYEYRIFPRRASCEDITDTELRKASEQICCPMLAPFVWDCPLRLHLSPLAESAARILGTHNFTSFAAVDSERTSGFAQPTTERTISESRWERAGDLLLYRITGTGFLHHMVRNLVGTFVECGCGRIAPERISTIMAARNRAAAGPTAPARGLFLLTVEY